jgi:hypothetical protein
VALAYRRTVSSQERSYERKQQKARCVYDIALTFLTDRPRHHEHGRTKTHRTLPRGRRGVLCEAWDSHQTAKHRSPHPFIATHRTSPPLTGVWGWRGLEEVLKNVIPHIIPTSEGWGDARRERRDKKRVKKGISSIFTCLPSRLDRFFAHTRRAFVPSDVHTDAPSTHRRIPEWRKAKASKPRTVNVFFWLTKKNIVCTCVNLRDNHEMHNDSTVHTNA